MPREKGQCTCSKQAFTGFHLLIMWESVRKDFGKKWGLECPPADNAGVMGTEGICLPNSAGVTFHEPLPVPSIDTPMTLTLHS